MTANRFGPDHFRDPERFGRETAMAARQWHLAALACHRPLAEDSETP